MFQCLDVQKTNFPLATVRIYDIKRIRSFIDSIE